MQNLDKILPKSGRTASGELAAYKYPVKFPYRADEGKAYEELKRFFDAETASDVAFGEKLLGYAIAAIHAKLAPRTDFEA